MLLRPDGEDGVIAIGQASHAWLAGQLARAWGNERFPAPAPWEAVCLGAEQHDVGMAMWDLAPTCDAETGWPTPFYRVDRRTHLRLWTEAPRRLLSQSAYAALLASLHGTGLYERFPPADDDPELVAAVQAYLDDQHAFQRELGAALGAPPQELRRNQALMAAWDDLSLTICQGRTPRAVPAVPTIDGATDVTVTEIGDQLRLDPWPLQAPEVVVHAEGRRLREPCADDEALRQALERAPLVALRFVLRA
jgi:hypothetical protein